MSVIHIHLNGDGCWPDLKTIPHEHGVIMEAAYLSGGMTSGKPSVTFRITLDDGRVVLAEIAGAMLTMVAAAVKGAAAKEGFDL